jgi:hypothetical protein
VKLNKLFKQSLKEENKEMDNSVIKENYDQIKLLRNKVNFKTSKKINE